MADCPKCGSIITYTEFKPIATKQEYGGNSWEEIAHYCPSCSCVLSVEIDPLAIKSDIIDGVAKLLGKRV